MQFISVDSETKLFRAGAIFPEIVCASFAMIEMPDGGDLDDVIRMAEAAEKCVLGGGPGPNGMEALRLALHQMFDAAIEGQAIIIGHNLANYDLGVFCVFDPTLMPKVWKALELGVVVDTLLREKVLELSLSGDLEFLRLANGDAMKRVWSLAEIEKLYLDRDRTADKKDDDAWRNHYAMLADVPIEKWPAEALDYVKADADGPLRCYFAQEKRAQENGGSFVTEEFQVGVQFALSLMSAWGIAVDLEKRDEIAAQLAEERRPERMKALLEAEILVPAGGFYMTTPKKHTKECAAKRKAVPKGETKPACECPRVEKKAKAKKEKITRKKLIALVEHICAKHGVEIKKNDATDAMKAAAREAAEASGEEFDEDDLEGNTSADKTVLQEIAHHHPALEEYQYRTYLDKLLTTELPRMSGPVVYPRFNVIVETGRTSSYAADEYPSANIQNVSAVKTLKDEHGEPTGEVNVRHCYVPRPKKVLLSIDFESLEFCSMAQVCYELFGYSVMRDLINSGRDAHSYTGGQIALHQHDEFRSYCIANKIAHDNLAVCDAFYECKKQDDKDVVKFWKQYRKTAKPVGFGLPGGMGAEKFVAFAAAHPYYVRLTIEQARDLKEIWLGAFPEMQDYFGWVEKQKDDKNEGCFQFVTPMGMVARGKRYTSICNGKLLQAPAAEGAKLAVWEIQRSCYDPGYNGLLFGQRPLAFIHDEILFEIDDDELAHERGEEAKRIMVACMQSRMPDVVIRAQAARMKRWTKEAEPHYDTNGRLADWELSPNYVGTVSHKKSA